MKNKVTYIAPGMYTPEVISVKLFEKKFDVKIQKPLGVRISELTQKVLGKRMIERILTGK